MFPERFKQSLQAVTEFAKKDSNVPDIFKTDVSDLAERLFVVLRNYIKLEEFKHDPEMTADLYFEISRGYVASPDMRAVWLQNLAKYHESVSIYLIF